MQYIELLLKKEPEPLRYATLFFLKRPSIPFVRLLTVEALLA